MTEQAANMFAPIHAKQGGDAESWKPRSEPSYYRPTVAPDQFFLAQGLPWFLDPFPGEKARRRRAHWMLSQDLKKS